MHPGLRDERLSRGPGNKAQKAERLCTWVMQARRCWTEALTTAIQPGLLRRPDLTQPPITAPRSVTVRCTCKAQVNA